MSIRPARIGDAREIAEVHVRTWQTAYVGIVPDDYLASLSVEKHELMWRDCILGGTPQLLVAAASEEVLGWVAFGPSRDAGAGADVAEVWGLYIGAAHWGRGIGRELWLEAQVRLQQQGFKSVGLWAFPENVRAGGFYRWLGFDAEPSSAKQFALGGALLNEVRYVRSIDA